MLPADTLQRFPRPDPLHGIPVSGPTLSYFPAPLLTDDFLCRRQPQGLNLCRAKLPSRRRQLLYVHPQTQPLPTRLCPRWSSPVSHHQRFRWWLWWVRVPCLGVLMGSGRDVATPVSFPAVLCARWGPQAGYFTPETAVRTGLPPSEMLQKRRLCACGNALDAPGLSRESSPSLVKEAERGVFFLPAEGETEAEQRAAACQGLHSLCQGP